jgi:hypothetical protein
VVTACRTSDGESLRGADCGRTSSLDRLVAKSLQKLADCPAAAEKPEKLRLVVRADFGRGTLGVTARKGAGPEALVACAKSALEGLSLEGVSHVNPRVTVTYAVAFDSAAPVQPSANPSSERSAAARDEGGGNADHVAQVAWDVALIRDAPRTGRVTARLKQGTTLHVGPAQDGWYPAKFGEGFTEEGWIYGAAIGR